MGEHVSVLLCEAIDMLNIKPNGVYVDLTLGRAGHSLKILEHLKDGELICFDKDLEAIEESSKLFNSTHKKVSIYHEDFRNFKKVLLASGVKKVDGIIADLGVSSPQLDEDKRGFSYRNDAYLDMRMDTSKSLTAYDVVNSYSLESLTKVLREYGEEKYAYQIAKNIIKARPVNTTFELVEIVKSSLPMKELKKVGHPAKQTFQAIRIEVNDELNALKEMLKDALTMLNVNGRIVVITFHSLEDRIVKNIFKEASTVSGSRHNVYTLPSEKDEPAFKLVNSKVIVPSEEEIENNHRSKSAKMRVIERIKDEG